jgi:uncharacterized membrane protein
MTSFIGHFHPVLVHLPIGILLLAILFEFLSRKEKYTSLTSAVELSWLLGGIAATFSCVTGYMLSLSGEYEGDTLTQHQYLGISVAGVSFLAFYLKKKKNTKIYTATVIATALGVMLTGHLGGTLTHGSDYLFNFKEKKVEKTTPFPKESGFRSSTVSAQNFETALAYQDVIQPILKEKCFACHNESKQKGKLRMDSPEFLLKGGENGSIFVNGKPDESEMIKRILLPLNHDDHMPPKEKPQITNKEFDLLKWWITQGADMHKTVKDLNPAPNIKALLGVVAVASVANIVLKDMPDATVGGPSVSDIIALKKMNVVAIPIGNDKPFLAVNFINRPKITAEMLLHLKALSKNIAWIKLSDAVLNDTVFMFLKDCENLTKLSLNNTNIDDTNLSKLLIFKHLSSLSLVNTKVTSQGILTLKNLPQLQKLFLFQTQIKPEEYKNLMSQMPNILIDLGGYAVPTLVTDTTELKPPPVVK